MVSAMATSDSTDLSVLIDRIACVSRLLDHQLWEAAIGLSLDKSSASGRRFARLIEDGALLEATVLLTELGRPSRSIASIAMRARTWICVIHDRPPDGAGMIRPYQAEHADLAAAVLMALLSACLDGPCTTDSPSVSRPSLQRGFDRHDI